MLDALQKIFFSMCLHGFDLVAVLETPTEAAAKISLHSTAATT